MSLRRRDQRDFEEEIQSHLDLETDRLIAEGMTPRDARLTARKKFGNVAAAQERYHDAGRFVWLEQLAADVRYATRMLRKTPLFTAMAVLTLALGIGANTAVFSVVNGVLLSRLPYREPDRLATLWESLPDAPRIMISYPDYLDWKARNRVFEDVALYGPYGGSANTGGDVPKQLSVGTATSNLFSLLGVKPLVGRVFADGDDKPGAPNIALLGAAYWRTDFAADPGVMGKTISLDGEAYKIIGVLPPLPGIGTLQVWRPMRPDLDSVSFNRGNHPGLHGIGRLKPGVSVEQMVEDLKRISREIVAEHPAESSGISAGGDALRTFLVRNVKPALLVMTWAVAFVLLIACVNVANLVLGRSNTRRKEIALRRALGAGESRVLRLLVVEHLLLALVGGGLGVALAYAGVNALVAARPTGLPRLSDIHVSVPVLAFATALSIITGLLFGVLPARQAARSDLNESLKESGRGTSATSAALRMGGVLMTVEVAMALVLLVGAGLLTRSFTKLMHVSSGVNPTGVMTGWISLPAKRYPDEDRQRIAMEEILRRVQTVPGVSSAALTSALALSSNMQNKITFEGRPRPKGQEPLLQVQLISPDYFRTMGIRLLRGRAFSPSDVKGGPPVAWIDDVLARKFFPNEDPVGKWFVHGGVDSKEPKELIVGVVNAVHDSGLDEQAAGIIYMPFDQGPQSWMALALKTTLPFEQVMPAVRREVASFDKQLPLSNEQPLEKVISGSIGQERFTMFVLGIFAAVALMLAIVGVYGVIAYFVAQRSREIGIRMALGARRADIVNLVTGRVLLCAGLGVVIGVTLATLGRDLMATLLYEVRSTDIPTYGLASLGIIAVAILAAVIPTVRATRVSPAVTMRSAD